MIQLMVLDMNAFSDDYLLTTQFRNYRQRTPKEARAVGEKNQGEKDQRVSKKGACAFLFEYHSTYLSQSTQFISLWFRLTVFLDLLQSHTDDKHTNVLFLMTSTYTKLCHTTYKTTNAQQAMLCPKLLHLKLQHVQLLSCLCSQMPHVSVDTLKTHKSFIVLNVCLSSLLYEILGKLLVAELIQEVQPSIADLVLRIHITAVLDGDFGDLFVPSSMH